MGLLKTIKTEMGNGNDESGASRLSYVFINATVVLVPTNVVSVNQTLHSLF